MSQFLLSVLLRAGVTVIPGHGEGTNEANAAAAGDERAQ
jgi:hypothetical protein